MIKGLIACVVDEEVVREVRKKGKKSGRTAADRFVFRALRRLSPNVQLVAAVEGESRTIEELIRLKPRLAVNLAFSALPCEPAFAGALEALGIAFTGSGAVGIGLANDKVLSRRLMESAGIRVPQFIELLPHGRPAAVDFPPPYFVKPIRSGNSFGVSVGSLAGSYTLALEQADRIWQKLEKPCVCDRFIAGREFHVGLIETQRGGFRAAGIVELYFRGKLAGRGFSTQVHIVKGKDRRAYKVRYRRAVLSPQKTREITRMAVEAARLLQLRGYAKIDFRMDEDERLFVLEANSNPGLWNGEIWRRPSFDQNLTSIMEAALRRARA